MATFEHRQEHFHRCGEARRLAHTRLMDLIVDIGNPELLRAFSDLRNAEFALLQARNELINPKWVAA